MLPISDEALYDGNKIEYAIFDESVSKRKAELLMERFCKVGKDDEDVSTKFLKEAIISGKKSRSQDVQLPPEIHVDGLPKTFSKSQTEAVIMAL